MKDNIAKINFATLLGALILFALPWTNIQCSGRDIAHQSGIQAIYGGASLAPELAQMGDASQGNGPDKSEIGIAFGLGIACIMVLVGVVVAGIALFASKPPAIEPGIIAMSALILIVIQSVMGFPVDKSVAKSQEEMASKTKQVQTTDAAPAVENAMAESMGQAMGAMVQMRTKRTPWFYFELLALAIPTALIINEAANEKKKKTQEPVENQEPTA